MYINGLLMKSLDVSLPQQNDIDHGLVRPLVEFGSWKS